MIVQPYPPDYDKEYECQCARCGSSADWRECEQCAGEGLDGHDCGEDCCVCLYPEDNLECDICQGFGGWYFCLSSKEYCEANPAEGREAFKRGQIEWYEVNSSKRTRQEH